MIFPTFAYLTHLEIPRPSFAELRFFYWSKLYEDVLEERGDRFTTLRPTQAYSVDEKVPIYLDDKKIHLFDARITAISQVKIGDLSDAFIKGDSDMTREELIFAFTKIYKRQHYNADMELSKISLRRINS